MLSSSEMVKKFLKSKNLSLTGEVNDPIYCVFCFKEKYEYHNPETNRITVLDCECEKRYNIMKNFIDKNKECILYPSKFSRSHAKFIQETNKQYLELEDMKYKHIKLLEDQGKKWMIQKYKIWSGEYTKESKDG